MSFLTAVSEIAKREALRLLEEETFEFETEIFTGYARAVKPGQHLAVDITEFRLAADTLSVQVKVSGRFLTAGTLLQSGTEIEVEATIDADIATEAQASLIIENSQFFVDPEVENLDLKVEVLALSPANLSGGKETISLIANTAFQLKKEGILEQINEELTKQKLDI